MDGIERGFDEGLSPEAYGYRHFSAMGLLNIAAEGTHSIAMEFKNNQAGSTVRCRRARILVMKH